MSRFDRFVDPHLTQNFLLGQPQVIDASVWFAEGHLHAHVTVQDDSTWTTRGLFETCSQALGLEHAPQEITLSSARRKMA